MHALKALTMLPIVDTSNELERQAIALHAMIFSQSGLDFAGRIRRPGDLEVICGNGPDEFMAPNPLDIRSMLTELFEQLPLIEKWSDLSKGRISRILAIFLEGFFWIHPFHDGNGRVGRLLCRSLIRATGRYELRPFPDKRKWQKKYLRGLIHSHRVSRALETRGTFKDPSSFVDLCTTTRSDPFGDLARALERLIVYSEPSSIEEAPPSWAGVSIPPPDSD